MFCPICGVQDVKSSQFCRACGAELSNLRATLEQRPDTNPIVANTAREEIGRALADKIRQSESASDLKLVIHEILPVAERFLETPEEKRQRAERIDLQQAQDGLRLARKGAVTSTVGFGAALVFLLIGLVSHDIGWLIPFVPSVIGFLIGVAILLYALFFTVLPAKPKDPAARSLKEILLVSRNPGAADPRAVSYGRNELGPVEPSEIPSVTEGTTRQL